MKIEIELTREQILSFMDFHRLTPYNQSAFKSAYEILGLIDDACSSALQGVDKTNTPPEIRRPISGRAKLLWQVNEQDDFEHNPYQAVSPDSDNTEPSPSQDPKKSASISFWNWVTSHKQSD